MAKAREITEIDCSESAPECAAKVLRARFAEVFEFRDAALEAKAVKGVHDMRVATRRLRSALRDFAFALKRKSLKEISKDIKQFADALGAARDEDVAIAALQKLRKKSRDKHVKKGIAKLIEERRARRDQAHLDLIEKLAV
jgi:CHAD domain-containing protein